MTTHALSSHPLFWTNDKGLNPEKSISIFLAAI